MTEPPKPRTKKASATRERILDAAMRRASTSGISALTLGSLASDLSMSKSGLYAHFGSKEVLQLAVIDAIGERFLATVIEPLNRLDDGPNKARELMRLWIAWSRDPDRPGGCPLAAASFAFGTEQGPVTDTLEAWTKRWRAIIQDTVRASRDRPASDDPNATRAASTAFAIYLAQHVEHYLLHDATAADRAIKQWRRVIDAG